MSESEQAHTQAQSETNPATNEQTETDTDWNSEQPIAHEQQMVFDSNGGIEPDEDSVETSLEAFGAEICHSDDTTQVAQPKASQFGVDDRATTPSKRTESDQRSLFADVEDDQQTLGGDDAATRCLFDDDGNDSGRSKQ